MAEDDKERKVLKEPEVSPPGGDRETTELGEFSRKGTDVFPQASTGGQDEERPSILPMDSAAPDTSEGDE